MLTIEALREALRPLWDAHSELIALWVFGSIAEGRADDQSDVDLAVLSRDAMSLLDQGALAAESIDCLDRNDVDLVELRSAIPFLQHRILTRGQILFERDAVARVTFQALVGAGILSFDLGENLQSMVGLRNIIVHGYAELAEGRLLDLVDHRLNELLEIAGAIETNLKSRGVL